MDKQTLKRGRQRPRNRQAAILAVGVLLAGILGAVGYVNYHLWAYPGLPIFPRPESIYNGPPRPLQSIGVPQANGPLLPLPPTPTPAAARDWRQVADSLPPIPQTPRQHSGDDLLAAVDKAFAEPDAELKPAVVFFPVADGEGKVRPDGFVLGQMAAFAAVYTPHRRLAMSTVFHRDELLLAGCMKSGVRINPEMIASCTAALETKLYVLPRMENAGDKHELTVEFHGDGKAYPDRTFRHEIPAGALNTAAGLAARDVLEAVGVNLDAAELQTVLTPRVRDDNELASLNQVLSVYPATPKEDKWLEFFCVANPRCALAWEEYLMHGHNEPPAEALKWFAQAQPPCDRVQISAARLLRNSGHAEDALLALLKLAPSHHGDTAYHSTLTRCAVTLGDDRLVKHLFDIWEKAGPGYANCLDRGGQLMEWGWMARGGGWANTVTGEGWKRFHERLGRAKEALEHAVEINPSGSRAHVALIQLARGLGLPREYMEDHFKQAVRARPHLFMAYAQKLEYLRPRWNGNQEEILAFGKECFDTGAWEENIAQMCQPTLVEVCAEMSDESLPLALNAGPVWDLLRSYYEAAEKHASPEAQALSRNTFARLGVIGGHFDEVVPAFQKLEETGVPDMTVFVDKGEYDYFCDLVHARTGKLPNRSGGRKRDQALSEASVAIAAGNLDEAEKDLTKVERGNADNDRLLDRYRGAVALGRKLRADGSVALSPQQVKDVCVLDNEQFWTVDGDKLTGRRLAGPTSLELPISLKGAVVTGTLAWEGDVVLMQLQLNARSLQHKVRISFVPELRQVTLATDHKALVQAPYQPGPQQFRFDLGTEEDRLEPTTGVRWRLPTEDFASGFALSIWPRFGEATLTIADLRIELKK